MWLAFFAYDEITYIYFFLSMSVTNSQRCTVICALFVVKFFGLSRRNKYFYLYIVLLWAIFEWILNNVEYPV